MISSRADWVLESVRRVFDWLAGSLVETLVPTTYGGEGVNIADVRCI